jgi:hypothetical protein
MSPHDEDPTDQPHAPGAADVSAAPDTPGRAHAPSGPDTTGHAGVDAVLISLADLEDRPVAEHVAVFESAHVRLREALAQAADDPSS